MAHEMHQRICVNLVSNNKNANQFSLPNGMYSGHVTCAAKYLVRRRQTIPLDMLAAKRPHQAGKAAAGNSGAGPKEYRLCWERLRSKSSEWRNSDVLQRRRKYHLEGRGVRERQGPIDGSLKRKLQVAAPSSRCHRYQAFRRPRSYSPWLIRMKRLGDFYRAGHHPIVVLAERSAGPYFIRIGSLLLAAAQGPLDRPARKALIRVRGALLFYRALLEFPATHSSHGGPPFGFVAKPRVTFKVGAFHANRETLPKKQ